MAKAPTVDHTGLDPEQRDLFEKFEADYNAIDQYLRRELRRDSQASFTSLVKEYYRNQPSCRDVNLLRAVAEIRNVIVHSKIEPYRYLAVPTPAIVQDLSSCRERLINPDRVIPKFQREVTILSPQDSLARVFRLISEKEYSQFPVCDDHLFQGLLTENGITRWIAQHVAREISLIELDDIRVEQVLQAEESRRNWQFVSCSRRVDEVAGMFAVKPLLEAILITATGKEAESLLGIVTRWDIVGAM
jgi:predicted transcriptional regulator